MMSQLIVASILKHLQLAGNYWTPESSLRVLVSADVPGFVPTEDLRGNLEEAKAKGWVDYMVDDFKVTKWRLLPAGRIALADICE